METRITKLLGIKYPVIQGGMAWVAEYHLAAAVSNAGGLGIIGAASAPPEVVREQIREAKKLTDKPLDVHLMIVNPEKFIPEVKALGAHTMNVHYEACTHLHRVIQLIKEAGMQPAVTINPATPVALLQDIIQDVYMVLVMSVNPGFGGQKFIEHSVEKVRELRALIERTGSKALIEVDGGVNLETGARLVEAGADVLVAGNAVFGAPDPEEMIRQLHRL